MTISNQLLFLSAVILSVSIWALIGALLFIRALSQEDDIEPLRDTK
jgi:hypothetical protein